MNSFLKRHFNIYNTKYWDGKLPLVKLSLVSPSDIDDDCGEYFSPNSKDKDIDSNYEIKINKKQNKKQIKSTLLHEMCHHSIFLKNKKKYWSKKILWHGKEWKQEMLRVGFQKPITRYT